MNQWIDFRKLRSEVSFASVLMRYGIEVKPNAKKHHGFCPLPNHVGKRRSPSFSANLEKGIFNCFGCGAKGNLLEFAVYMEKLDPDKGEDVRKAALLIQKHCGVSTANPKPRAEQQEFRQPAPAGKVVINAPLDFELKRLDPTHPYLDKRGFSKEIIAQFGLGYCSQGLLAGRIAIPIHREDGKLVGYAGRIVDDTKINEENPRYLFPPKRERGEVLHEFHTQHLVYNAHRLKGPLNELIVVEGFASVWWLTQMGFPHAVGLMGANCSELQAKIIVELVAPDGRVWMISDGDPAGRRCATQVLERIAPARFIKWFELGEGKQPTDYPGAMFRERLR